MAQIKPHWTEHRKYTDREALGVIRAMLDDKVARVTTPSPEAIARRVRIGCRHNGKPHQHRDRVHGVFIAVHMAPDDDMLRLRNALLGKKFGLSK